jgi:hypothetical protein
MVLKKTSVSISSISTQFLKRGLVSAAKTESGTAPDEGASMHCWSVAEVTAHQSHCCIYYFRDDDQPVDN